MQLVSAGRYQLLHPLGQGGMATVWQAWDQRLRVWRAIKVLHAGSKTASDRERFEREARTMARLHHRHILAVHDVFEEDGDVFLVMDYAPGGSLADALVRHGRLGPRRAATAAAQVLDALHEAHQHGIVHRDIKAANILLSRDGDALVADFGIARLFDDPGLTRGMIGTPQFMAPEQRRDAAGVDGRADVYAVGAMLVHLVTGQPTVDVDRLSPEDLEARAFPPELAALTAQATRYAPGDRPTASALRDRLLHAIEGLPDDPHGLASAANDLPPPPPSTHDLSADTWADPPLPSPVPLPTLRPRRSATALAAAAVLLAGGGAITATWWTRLPPRPAAWVVAAPALAEAARPDLIGAVVDGDTVWLSERSGGILRVGLTDSLPRPWACTAPPAEVVDAEAGRVLLRTADGIVTVGADCTTDAWPQERADRVVAFATPRPGLLISDGTVVEHRPAPSGPSTLLGRVAAGNVDTSLGSNTFSPGGDYLTWSVLGGEREPTLHLFDVARGITHMVVADSRLLQTGGIVGSGFVDDHHLWYALGEGPGVATLFEVDVAEPALAHRRVGTVEHGVVGRIVGAGETVLVVTLETQYDVWTGSVSGERATRLTAEDADDRPSGWTGDGRVLFTSNRTGDFDVLAQAPGAEHAEVVAGGPGLQTYGKEMGGALYWWTMDPTVGGTATLMIRDADGERALRVERVEGTFRNQSRPPPDAAGFDCAAGWCAVCLVRDGAAEVTWFDPQSGADREGPFGLPGEGCAMGPDGSVWAADGPGDLARRITPEGTREVAQLRGVSPQYVQPTPLGLLVSGRSAKGWAAGWHGADGRFVPVVEADVWRSLPHLDPTQTRLAWLQATITGDAWRLRPR